MIFKIIDKKSTLSSHIKDDFVVEAHDDVEQEISNLQQSNSEMKTSLEDITGLVEQLNTIVGKASTEINDFLSQMKPLVEQNIKSGVILELKVRNLNNISLDNFLGRFENIPDELREQLENLNKMTQEANQNIALILNQIYPQTIKNKQSTPVGIVNKVKLNSENLESIDLNSIDLECLESLVVGDLQCQELGGNCNYDHIMMIAVLKILKENNIKLTEQLIEMSNIYVQKKKIQNSKKHTQDPILNNLQNKINHLLDSMQQIDREKLSKTPGLLNTLKSFQKKISEYRALTQALKKYLTSKKEEV